MYNEMYQNQPDNPLEYYSIQRIIKTPYRHNAAGSLSSTLVQRNKGKKKAVKVEVDKRRGNMNIPQPHELEYEESSSGSEEGTTSQPTLSEVVADYVKS
jgi:hypothetical protein